MKKQILFFAAISYFTGISEVSAQSKENIATNNFSLKQCIDYALQNNSSMKNATLGEAIAKSKVNEVTGIGLPQANGSVQLLHNDPLRRMFLGAGNPFFPLPEGTKSLAIDNIFQLKSAADAGVTVSQLIFSNSYLVGLQAAKTYREISVKTTEQTKIQIIEQVTKAYYMVLVNEERMKLFEKNIARVDSILAQTKAMYQNGMVENIDVSRMQVAYNNLTTEKEKFSNLMVLSKVLLKYQMAMPLESELILMEKIDDFKIENITQENATKINFSSRIERSLLETQNRLQMLELKNNKGAYLPSLAAFANVGYFSQSPKFDWFTATNPWYNYGMFGVTMSVPIFDGFQKHNKIQQSKLNLKITENNIENLERTIDLQVKSADVAFKNSLASLEMQKKNIELAKEVARVSKAKYEQGVGSNLEVVSAETALKEAQTNYYNSLYDLLVAKVDLDKAMGNLK